MSYKIFTVKVSKFGVLGVIITSAFSNAGGYPKAESFLLIPDGKNKANNICFFKSIKFNVKSFGDVDIEIDDDFMLKEALNQADIDVSLYLDDKIASGNLNIPDSIDITSNDDNSFLIHYWTHGFIPSLRKVHGNTENQELIDFLAKVIKLPVVVVKDIEIY